jgi:hypothetical protein
MKRKLPSTLLTCGILSSVLYFAADICALRPFGKVRSECCVGSEKCEIAVPSRPAAGDRRRTIASWPTGHIARQP